MTEEGRKVEHHYQDHSNVVSDGLGLESSSIDGKQSTISSDRNFPVKLHYMLGELEQDGLDHIVSWQPHGRAFVVHKQEEFVSCILPMWFRQTKFASFQRQLNLYGFKRLSAGKDKNGYYHELFLRGKRFLAHRIPRCKLKGEGARKPTSPETEPNFYTLPYLPQENSAKMAQIQSQHPNLYGTGRGGLPGGPLGVGPSALASGIGAGLSMDQLSQAASARSMPMLLQQDLAMGGGMFPSMRQAALANEQASILAAQRAAYLQPSVAGLRNPQLGMFEPSSAALFANTNMGVGNLMSNDLALQLALSRGMYSNGSRDLNQLLDPTRRPDEIPRRR